VNGRDRVLAALRGERADRVPVLLHNFLMAARENGNPRFIFNAGCAIPAETPPANLRACSALPVDPVGRPRSGIDHVFFLW
jgi:uroporphyrinogen-III decarboxylase